MKAKYINFGPRHAIAISVALYALPSWATEFELGDGWKGSWTSSLSLGTAVRARSQDTRLYGQANGALVGRTDGTGNNTVDEGNLNYNKGDPFTTQVKLISEVSLQKGDMGLLVRGKAWYDYTLSHSAVEYGNQANGYNGYSIASDSLGAKQPLSDKGFDKLNRFKGLYLLDAYLYNTFDVGGHTLQLRAGNQVVNWGESLFIQGLNQVAPIDVPSFRKPGVQLKEVFLPVPLLYGNLSLGNYGSIEAFYQLQWKPTPIEAGCGNYWAVSNGSISSNPGVCNNGVTLAKSNPYGAAAGAYYPYINGDDGKNSGQYGVAYRFNVAPLDTEFGLYAQRLNSRTPVLDVQYGTYPGTVSPAAAKWDYINDIKIFGVSATTNVLGWSLAAEVSRQNGVAAQIDGNDLLLGSLAFIGPMGTRATAASTGSGFLQGYTRTNKTQVQVNGVKAGNNILGANTYIFVAEAAAQWNNLPDYRKDPNALRYGRNFIFGPGPSALYGAPCSALNISAEGCEDGGYVTPFSWGYRVKLDLIYDNVAGTGVSLTPSVFFAHDVKGYSVDSQFLQDRRTLGLGLRFAFNKQYTLDLGAVTYNRNAKFDPLRDRDFYSANLGVTF
jgi:hypothetical protein